VARNWDARVRGASQKVTNSTDEGNIDREAEETAKSRADTDDQLTGEPEQTRSAPLPGLRATSEAGAEEFPTQNQNLSGDLQRSLAETLGKPSNAAAPSRRAVEAELVAEGLSQAVKATDIAVAIVDRSTGLIRWTSDSWIDRFGEKDLIARHMPSATEFGESPLPPPGESWRRTRTLLFEDGAERLVDLVLVGATASDGSAIVSVVALDRAGSRSLVTELQQVMSFIEGAVAEASEGSVAVLYVDLDRFKVVHDLVGNIEALRILDLVNQRVAGTVRGSDLLFRLHSDEFVVIACELEHPAAAEELAERIRASVATLTDLGHDLAITASVGVAVADDVLSAEELLSAAETAVYVAKGRGRNRIALHDEELRTRTQRLMVVERQLRQAIDRKDVRFAYQPLVEIASGRVTGAEALLRLGGEVGLSAVEVVAAAEHSGLMGALGVLVLEGVDEQLSDFLRSSEDDHVIMVNLSATQLADEDLVRTLDRLAHRAGISPGRLAVEIPELVVRDHPKAVARLAKLVQPTFKLGIDGFGTGLLEFDALDQLPADYIKLHRSVTTSLTRSSSEEMDRIRVMIERAQTAGVDVVALGVEDQEQAVILGQLGCRKAQGFLYAGAVTSEKLLELVAGGIDLSVVAGKS